MLLFWCFTVLRHFSGHFERSQLTYPYCSWAILLGRLPVLSAHSFIRNWQLPFLNQRKGENGRRNYFMTSPHERMFPDVRIEPATVHIPEDMHATKLTRPAKIISWPVSTKECCRTCRYYMCRSNLQPSTYKADAHQTELPCPTLVWLVPLLLTA